MLRRVASVMWFVVAGLAYYYVRKVPAWGQIQRVVSYLPTWIITTGAVTLLCLWVWYLLPRPVTSRLVKSLRIRGDIPIVWIALASFAVAPLGIYYVTEVASSVKAAAYLGFFVLLLLSMLVRMLFEERREVRRTRRAGKSR